MTPETQYLHELIARMAHQVNKAYCEAIGDSSQPEWLRAPQWQRDSAMNGVKYHLGNPGASPADSHNNWLAEKIKDGWVYGAEKDPTNKLHPCIRPYDELPIEQRVKDHLFIAVVRELNRMANEKVT